MLCFPLPTRSLVLSEGVGGERGRQCKLQSLLGSPCWRRPRRREVNPPTALLGFGLDILISYTLRPTVSRGLIMGNKVWCHGGRRAPFCFLSAHTSCDQARHSIAGRLCDGRHHVFELGNHACLLTRS